MKKIGILIIALALLLVLTACGCEHEWKEAACGAPKTCTLCGKTEGEPGDHTWQDATCDKPRTCSTCGITAGRNLDHKWLDANCQTPATCEYCGVSMGEVDWRHTLKEGEVLTKCEICGTVVEVFYDAKGAARYYTEFEVAGDGSYINPVTASGKRGMQWYNSGNLTYCQYEKTFCVDGKIYYRGSLLYDVSANTREDLIEIAKQHIEYQYAQYYENKDQDMLLLASSNMLTGNLGQVYAVVDAYGERYVFIHKGPENYYPEDTVVIEYDWRS